VNISFSERTPLHVVGWLVNWLSSSFFLYVFVAWVRHRVYSTPCDSDYPNSLKRMSWENVQVDTRRNASGRTQRVNEASRYRGARGNGSPNCFQSVWIAKLILRGNSGGSVLGWLSDVTVPHIQHLNPPKLCSLSCY